MAASRRNASRKVNANNNFVESEEGHRSWKLSQKLKCNSPLQNLVHHLSASDLTYQYVQKTGLSHPLLIKDNHEKLGMK